MMTKKDKELLLRDLCARSPYGVFVGYEHYTDRHIVVTKLTGIRGGLYYDADGQIPDNELKPYLRPMSSMTEAERKEYISYFVGIEPLPSDFTAYPIEHYILFEYEAKNLIDWLNAHHFDYRGLIEKGLALEAPEGMYER